MTVEERYESHRRFMAVCGAPPTPWETFQEWAKANDRILAATRKVREAQRRP